MTVEIPHELIEQICEGNAVLFVGAGLSAGVGLPRWPELMYQMIIWAEEHNANLDESKEELIKLTKEKEFLLVAEELRDRVGIELFEKFMHSVFRDDTKTPSRAHMILPEIPFAAVLTTNYDVLLENAYKDCRGVRPHTCTHANTPKLVELNKKNEFYILKIHGDIDHFETVIVGRSDYRLLMFKNRAYHDFLKTLFMTRTVFFVGFSLTDPDLMLLLDELGTFFKSHSASHYALMNTKEAGNIKRKSWERDYNIQIIPYEATEGHPEVYQILSEISQQAAEKSITYALRQVRPGLFSSNFIVKGPNLNRRRLFVEKLIETIKSDRHYQSLTIQVDMEECIEGEFFKMFGERYFEAIMAEYLSMEFDRKKGNFIKDESDFEGLIRTVTSRVQGTNQKQARIVLLLFNADTMNTFDGRIKDRLRHILDVLGPTLTAIIVAQELDTEDISGWMVSPWFSRFLIVRLQ